MATTVTRTAGAGMTEFLLGCFIGAVALGLGVSMSGFEYDGADDLAGCARVCGAQGVQAWGVHRCECQQPENDCAALPVEPPAENSSRGRFYVVGTDAGYVLEHLYVTDAGFSFCVAEDGAPEPCRLEAE
jgi:hypothetical protein